MRTEGCAHSHCTRRIRFNFFMPVGFQVTFIIFGAQISFMKSRKTSELKWCIQFRGVCTCFRKESAASCSVLWYVQDGKLPYSYLLLC